MSTAKSRIETAATNGDHTTALPAMPEVPSLPSKITIDLDAVKAFAIKYVYQISVAVAVLAWGYWFFCTKASIPAPVYHPAYYGQAGSPVIAQPVAFAPAKVPVEARPVGTVSFVVAATGKAGTSVFLNSKADYKSGGGQSICLQEAAAAGFNPTMYVGRTVTATGPVSNDKYGNQLSLVKTPGQLSVR